MNQSIMIGLTNTTCSFCHCKNQSFLHNASKGENDHSKICPSCVLFEHIELYCPECFNLHDGTGELICCCDCGSNTHRKCVSGEDDVTEFRCSTCKHPERLILDLKESKDVKEDKAPRKMVDFQAARLVLTSASIMKELMSKNSDELNNYAMKCVKEAAAWREKATNELSRLTISKESNDGPSLSLALSTHEI